MLTICRGIVPEDVHCWTAIDDNALDMMEKAVRERSTYRWVPMTGYFSSRIATRLQEQDSFHRLETDAESKNADGAWRDHTMKREFI